MPTGRCGVRTQRPHFLQEASETSSTPNRTRLLGLVDRSVLGGLSGAAVAVAGAQSIALALVRGVVGAIAGEFAGYEVRKRLVRALKGPDFVIALLEDAVAIGGGLLVVSRF